ncbi:cis-aconitate decarboxylase [Eucyclogobius newberryi]|uniref:cis-aconitate decarboxylase n=1 Tax=Eucyclogobius newberryi TaxID=166745 RepID=UPI003B5A73B7
MMLDTLGVGLIGSRTAVFNKALTYSQSFNSKEKSSIWGKSEISLPPNYAAFVNGIAVHSMDFDDTWHPATHPSGAVLPALLALAEVMPRKPSGLELLLAFNVGIEVQGRLLRFSREAHNIPERFHPPSVVGVMGSAAASAKLLGLSALQCSHALAVAASSAGAPLANTATQTKPLHIGNATRRGLEAAQLVQLGLKGNPAILDMDSGFGIYYKDYNPSAMPDCADGGFDWTLDKQDVAFKRIPAHLGMHWVADAALAARAKMETRQSFEPSEISSITLRVPSSKYINCALPTSQHQARHSFQFNACSALLDNEITVDSFSKMQINRKALKELLSKVKIETPADNKPSFENMYSEVQLETNDGHRYAAACDTFYGHWRRPLSQEDLIQKFKSNAATVLTSEGVHGIIDVIENIEDEKDCASLISYLKMANLT